MATDRAAAEIRAIAGSDGFRVLTDRAAAEIRAIVGSDGFKVVIAFTVLSARRSSGRVGRLLARWRPGVDVNTTGRIG